MQCSVGISVLPRRLLKLKKPARTAAGPKPESGLVSDQRWRDVQQVKGLIRPDFPSPIDGQVRRFRGRWRTATIPISTFFFRHRSAIYVSNFFVASRTGVIFLGHITNTVLAWFTTLEQGHRNGNVEVNSKR